MLTPSAAFRRVDGLDPRFAINYGDIDYCLRLRRVGLRSGYTPHAELYHFESLSREKGVSQNELDLYLERWSSITRRDPYYNQHMLRTAPLDFSVAAKDWIAARAGVSSQALSPE